MTFPTKQTARRSFRPVVDFFLRQTSTVTGVDLTLSAEPSVIDLQDEGLVAYDGLYPRPEGSERAASELLIGFLFVRDATIVRYYAATTFQGESVGVTLSVREAVLARRPLGVASPNPPADAYREDGAWSLLPTSAEGPTGMFHAGDHSY